MIEQRARLRLSVELDADLDKLYALGVNTSALDRTFDPEKVGLTWPMLLNATRSGAVTAAVTGVVLVQEEGDE